ncbi:unnamed protein product [Cercospora beticola]|nr:unnamed protein product [Cercospora beticola]
MTEAGQNSNKATPTAPHDAKNETPAPEPEYLRGTKLWLTAISLALCIFFAALDGTIVSTAIPQITSDFDSLADVGWYGSSFYLTTAAFQTVWGRLYKFFWLKSMFLLAIAIFELGSLICAVAPNSAAFIVGRAIAGVGASGLQSGVYTIPAFSVSAQWRPVFLAGMGVFYAVAACVGPLVGGAFTTGVTWRWCFWINLPLGAVTGGIILLLYKTPEQAAPPKMPVTQKLRQLNPLGVVLIIGAVTCYLLAVQYGGQSRPWGSSVVIGLLVGFVLVAALFVAEELWMSERALFQPRLFKFRAVTIGCPFLFFSSGVYSILLYYIPIYFQAVRGVSAASSGVRLLPFVLAMSISLIISGGILRKFGYYKPNLILGPLLASIGTGLIYTWSPDTSAGKWIGYQILVAIGMGITLQAPLLATQASVDKADTAPATSMVVFFQGLGGAIWVSAANCIFANELTKYLRRMAPSINTAQILSLDGASSLADSYTGSELQVVQDAYMHGLRCAYAIAIGCAGICCVLGCMAEWKKINVDAKPKAVASEDEVAQVTDENKA